jgi:hypothetical protein
MSEDRVTCDMATKGVRQTVAPENMDKSPIINRH